MAKKQRYHDIKHYESKLHKLKKDYRNFQTENTTYTKKIVTDDEIIFFNEGGEDNNSRLLLINAVRNDAKKYLEKNVVQEIYRKETCFFNMLDVIESKKVIRKIDLKSAYWEYARKIGVITEETNNKFLEWYKSVDPYFAKQDRLAALGALATTKYTNIYINGRWSHSLPVYTEPTRPLYMEICNGVDRLMKDCNFNVPGCKYYYWDCIFVEDDFSEEAIEYLKSRGYEVSVEETKLEYVTIGNVGYLLSMMDGKVYMTKKENKILLNFDDEDEQEFNYVL